ncbi:hypothetical protein [Nocardioides sp. Kera G14]|uniref:hypothetical protein n=1 Tax=Nocardioides sp. Kera G14 TaxID=2884264 RepID=UPI001D112DB4|nr:hypothetical protein [Nocardioides sp. Kera G14]UDY23977.1 hypothetical protein LH076_01375 [Nocardioides sp. Kera G14]
MSRWTRGWVLALVGLVALVLVAVAAYAWTRPDPVRAEDSARAALEAAEQAAVPVTTYDYRTLDDDEAAAKGWLTGHYRSAHHYDDLWQTIKKNAVTAKTVITGKVVGSGIVHATPDRVQVLVLIDRPTSNVDTPTPVTYEDHVTLTMVQSSGRWLVDDLVTQ